MRSNTNTEKCGTCQYWTGRRNPVFDKNGNPKVDIIDRVGNCENENYKRFCGTRRTQNSKCIHFSKWTEIL